MKKTNNILRALSVLTIVGIFMTFMVAAVDVWAVDTSQSYDFSLKVENEDSISVNQGESFDATLTLTRTDSSGDFLVYAITTVMRFNSDMFTLDSYETADGVDCNVSALSGSMDGWSDITLNYLANKFDGDTWSNPTVMITLHFTAISDGSAAISVQSGKVSTYTGMDSFSTTMNEVSVLVKGADEPVTTEPSGDEPTTTASSPKSGEETTKAAGSAETKNTSKAGETAVASGTESPTETVSATTGITDSATEKATSITESTEKSTGTGEKQSEITSEQTGSFPVWLVVVICVVVIAIIVTVVMISRNRKQK